MDGQRPSVHWDDEIIGFDMHPTEVDGVGAVKTLEGQDSEGRPVKFVEVWDGSADAGEPVGCAGIRPTSITSIAMMPLARWRLVFTPTSVHLNATALPAPVSWEDED